MTDEAANHPLLRRWWVGLLFLLVAGVLVFLLSTAIQIARTASLEQLHPADAIVVFGAAEYLRQTFGVARLGSITLRSLSTASCARRHHRRRAADPKFSEGGVGNDYLHKRGIPENALIAETQGSDTAESAQRIAVIMRANSLHSCVAVSDAYHVFRIRKLLEYEKGRSSLCGPRPDSRPHSARCSAPSQSRAKRQAWASCGEWEYLKPEATAIPCLARAQSSDMRHVMLPMPRIHRQSLLQSHWPHIRMAE